MEEEIILQNEDEEEVQVQEENFGSAVDLRNYVKKNIEYVNGDHEYGCYIETEDIGIRMLSTSDEGYIGECNLVGGVNSGSINFGATKDDIEALIEMIASENNSTIEITSKDDENENTIEITPIATTIKNVVTPEQDGDAVNKKYVDDIVGDINTILSTLTTPADGGDEN